MIARLTVVDGTLTEYPLAEKVRGGWQNGVTFYPDERVTKVLPLRVALAGSAERAGDDKRLTVGDMRALVHGAGVDPETFDRWLDQHDRELWEAVAPRGA
jgi:hypothetical protein